MLLITIYNLRIIKSLKSINNDFKKSLSLIGLCTLIISISSMPLPLNQYAYSLARNYLKGNEKFSQNTDKLSIKEKVVNLYYEKLKHDELIATKNKFYPALPVEDTLNEIVERPLYSILKQLPKGGNLHIHENQMLNRKIFLEIILSLPDSEFLYICIKENHPDCVLPSSCKCTENYLKFFKKNVENGFIKLNDSGLSVDDIVKRTTLIGILNSQNPKVSPTDSKTRWKLSNQGAVFDIYDDLFKYNVTRYAYMKAVLDGSLEENSQLVEFRRGPFGKTFYFDSNDDRVLIKQDEELENLLEFKNQYKIENPKFIDFVYLIYSSRSSKKATKNILASSLDLQEKFPEFIRGYDLVGEEDAGYSLLFHSDSLIDGFNRSLNKNPGFNYFFHAAETNMPEDDAVSRYDDSVSALDNIYDAIVFKTYRIGHGLGFIKHPELYPYLKDRNIAIEICPSSNQILGYFNY